MSLASSAEATSLCISACTTSSVYYHPHLGYFTGTGTDRIFARMAKVDHDDMEQAKKDLGEVSMTCMSGITAWWQKILLL